MSTDSENTQDAGEEPVAEDVAQGVTNEPRGTGDRDEDSIQAGGDSLYQAGGGH